MDIPILGFGLDLDVEPACRLGQVVETKYSSSAFSSLCHGGVELASSRFPVDVDLIRIDRQEKKFGSTGSRNVLG